MKPNKFNLIYGYKFTQFLAYSSESKTEINLLFSLFPEGYKTVWVNYITDHTMDYMISSKDTQFAKVRVVFGKVVESETKIHSSIKKQINVERIHSFVEDMEYFRKINARKLKFESMVETAINSKIEHFGDYYVSFTQENTPSTIWEAKMLGGYMSEPARRYDLIDINKAMQIPENEYFPYISSAFVLRALFRETASNGKQEALVFGDLAIEDIQNIIKGLYICDDIVLEFTGLEDYIPFELDFEKAYSRRW